MRRILTLEEALEEVKRRKKFKHGYGVFVRPFLPTNGNMGFEGCALVKVDKKTFMKTLVDLLENLGERGAKIEMSIPEKEYESFII